jgi:hypothetical protein
MKECIMKKLNASIAAAVLLLSGSARRLAAAGRR